MAQSEIEDTTTASDRLIDTIRLTPATAIHVARAHLSNSGELAAVVYRSGRPVGVVTAAALTTGHTASGTDAPISTVMDHVTVPVRPGADANETVRAFTRAAWDWLDQRPGPRLRAERRAAASTVPNARPATRATPRRPGARYVELASREEAAVR